MSYQALLFCPDEKTARVVTQVLSELEFSVEPCNEPFAAVKKLMVQHFDALVVDCDNEQNAALLFKSARNSESNQASLAVAVVEGQLGVAKAFRLGANLVLTKPIHVEQSKGTLRVARGLLRKGQAAKPAAASSGVLETITARPLSTPTPFSAPVAMAPPPPLASASFELDAEPTPQPDAVDAALLECMPDSAPSAADNLPSVPEVAQSKQYAWQPRSTPMAEPMASALRRAAEAAGKTEFESPATSHGGTPQGGSGAAAAPARAKEVPAPRAVPLESRAGIAPPPTRSEVEPEIIQDPAASKVWEKPSLAQTAPVPSFASVEGHVQHASGAGGSKKTLLVAVVLLGVAAASYFGWTKMQSTHQQAAPQSIAPTDVASLPPAPASSLSQDPAATPDVVVQPSQQAASTSSPTASSSKPSAAVLAEAPGSKALAASSEIAPSKTPAAVNPEPSQPLVVKNNLPTQPKVEAPVQEPEQAPALTSIAPDANNAALSGLVDTTAVNAKAPQQTMRISQGVSQGLLLKRVQPTYPPQALQMHMEGTVELQANISKIGTVTGIKQLTGQVILGRSAIDAVRQWKYKPYYLNGEPVEIQTQITVNFKLP